MRSCGDGDFFPFSCKLPVDIILGQWKVLPEQNCCAWG